jgi:hypothetical protein
VALQGGDDIFLPDKISLQVKWFSESGKRVLCYHDAEVFESSTNEKICNYSEMAPLISGIGPATLIERMRLGVASAVMVRTSSIPEYGFDTRLPMVSDWKFQIDCLLGGGEYGFIDGVYTRYRRHGENSRLKASKQYYADCLMTTYLIEKEYVQYALACRKARARIYGGMAIDMAARNNYRSVFQMYVKSVKEAYSWKLLPGIIFVLLPETLRKILIKLFGKSIPELTYSQH